MAATKILSLAQLKGITQPIAAISWRSSSRVDFIPILHLVLLVALCGVLYFPYLGSTPFFDKGEPREALAVQDIVERGDWAFPLKRAEIIPSKPPLFHWTAALTSRLTGSLTEGTVRFPSALYATLGVLLIYCLARKLFSGRVALLSGAILATTLVYENQALNARVDMTLTFFVMLSLVLFYAIYRAFLLHPLWYYAFYAVTGLGMLAKGPLGILLPALIIGAFLTARREWNWLIKFGFHPGLILTLLIGLGWYGLAITRGGEGFYQRQIVQENWARFFGGSGHSKSLYYYVSYLFIQGLPWSIFLPCVAWDSFKKGFFSDSGTVFFKVWLLVMFVFFSLSSGKRAVYLLPLYPALSVLMAAWFYQDDVEDRARLILYRSIAVLAGLIGFTLLIAVLDTAWNHDSGWLFELIEGLLKPKDRVSLMLVKNSLTTLAWSFTMVVLFSAVLWFYLAQRLWMGHLRSGAQCLVLVSVLLAFVSRMLIMPVIAEARSYRGFMEAVNQHLQPGDTLYLYGDFFNSDPVVFYHGKPIETLNQPVESMAAMIGTDKNYILMAKQTWNEIQNDHRILSAPLLESTSTGPEGDAPLVLVEARSRDSAR